MDLTGIPEFRETAATRLRGHPVEAIPDTPGMRRAAVVLCVVPDPTGTPAPPANAANAATAAAPVVLAIRRAARGRNAGQWALPGGRLEPGETAEEAGLRELHEEIGLAAQATDVLGRLDDFPAASGFAITPIVAVPKDPGPLTPNPDEVESVHTIPLARLAADGVPYWIPQPDGDPLLQMRIAPDIVIHAPTGALLWQFREVVLLGRPAAQSRIAGFRQPLWTRR